MGVWTGWQNDLLRAVGYPTSQANRDFLNAWHQNAESNCPRNPVDISKQEPRSSNCHHLVPGRTAQNYPSPGAAAAAFNGQIRGSEFLWLDAGFRNSSLSPSFASDQVVAALRTWGSAGFADFLSGTGTGDGSGGGSPTHFHQGWDDLRRSVNHKYPNALTDSQKMTSAALRKLAHARKVRL